ncbi:WD40 repeat domain-containing protein [Vacuolonema iberomarrocanum]|uniref:WD40 repeat domain-containing protein n=1 Tax=Vacuolonema iberomarrocanum TaxID=3454632 RepID=UPI0019FE41F5|nr:hypothetical protein [filamentous cyanobacterium LEGE 07170]
MPATRGYLWCSWKRRWCNCSLTELWKHRQDNSLTLYSYTRLGGILGTLRQRADAVYAAFDPQEKEAARDIFLALTQINQDMEDTRRRVAKADLVTPRHPADVVTRVLQQLTAEQLVVTSELVTKGDESRIAMVEVAHEALIRHWPQLRAWIEENHDLLRMRQKLETKAEEWRSHKQSSDDLLRGRPLREAQTFQKTHGKIFPLSNETQQFVKKSRSQRTRTRLLQAGVGVVAVVAVMPLVLSLLSWATAPLVFRQQRRQMLTSFHFYPNQSSLILMDGLGTVRKWDTQTEDLETLLAPNSMQLGRGSNPYMWLSALQLSEDGSVVAKSELDSVRYLQANQPEVLLQDEAGKAQAEALGTPGVISLIVGLALGPEGDQVAFQNNFSGIYLWNPSRDRLTQLLEETMAISYPALNAPTLAFSPDGETLGAIANNSLYLWTIDGTPINQQAVADPATPGFQSGLTYLAFSPDGQRIATSMQGDITLWDTEGQRIATLSLPDTDADAANSTPGYAGVSNVTLSLFAFSPDSRQIATFTNNTLLLWEADTGTLITTVADNDASETQIEHSSYPLQPSHLSFSPEGSILVKRKDEEILLWSVTGDEIAALPISTAASDPPSPFGMFILPHFTSFDFHPTEAQLVTSQLDGTVKLWSLQGEELGILQTAMAPPEAPPSSNPLNPRSWQPNFQGTYDVRFRSDGEAIAILNSGSLRLVTPDGMEILDIRPNGRPIP